MQCVKHFYIIYCILCTVHFLSFTLTVTSSENNLSKTQISFIGVMWKWIYLFPFNFPFDTISERRFSALKELKTKTRSTTHKNGLDHLILLYVYLVCVSRKILSKLIFARKPTSFLLGKTGERRFTLLQVP